MQTGADQFNFEVVGRDVRLMPTAIPLDPFAKGSGNAAGKTTGSSSVPS
jgi:hypothetical protein